MISLHKIVVTVDSNRCSMAVFHMICRPGGTAPVAPALAGPIFSSKAGIVRGSVGHAGRSMQSWGTIRKDATKLRTFGWGMIARARLTNLK